MKFKKILSVGVDKYLLDPQTWDKIDALTESRVSLDENDKQIDKYLAEADCLLVTFNKADKEMINKSPNLKYIGALATGVGKIDTDYASKKRIIVTNIPGYSTEGVAELVFAMLLENLRDISRAKTESKQKRTSESNFHGREIKGKKFGILGLGRIGRRTAEIAQAFGADVSYWSKNRKKDVEKKGIKYSEINKLLSGSDIISIHFALNDKTENIIYKDRVNRIKKGAIVINTAPLELLDITAFESRLKKGDLTFIFDHTDPGDITNDNLAKLRQYRNCITYPVLGYWTEEAKKAKQDIFVNNMKAFLMGKPQNVVN